MSPRPQSPLVAILVLHNAEDYRVPLGQALDYYASLKAQGKEAKLAVFPDSSHGMSRDGTPEQRIARLELILEWFDRHLGRDDPNSHPEEVP